VTYQANSAARSMDEDIDFSFYRVIFMPARLAPDALFSDLLELAYPNSSTQAQAPPLRAADSLSPNDVKNRGGVGIPAR
jgi:hypothetical protein